MKVALYGRVSTTDKGQDPENQLTQMREWCSHVGHTIVNEYVDYESGRKADREQFQLMFDDAHQHEFDLVLVWALDRFSREGMTQTVIHLQRLESYGVAFHSYTEPLMSTDNELVRDIVLAIMASLAKQEAIKISQRTKAGLERARAKGHRLGRPPIDDHRRLEIATLVAAVGVYEAAKTLKIDRKTAAKYA